MYAHVNGASLYFDVEGSGLVADGPSMKERPTVVLVHGGPGGDHSVYKPAFGALSDIAQVVYYDHRGNGRSDLCTSDTWNLDQWADDLRGLCDYLGLVKPIIVGASFGGFVAQAYALRHPGHASKIALISTTAKAEFPLIYDAFGALGGAKVKAIAEHYWENPTDQSRAEYRDNCVPYYSVKEAENKDWLNRVVWRNETALWFNGPKNEQGRMDFRDGLEQLTCPVLVMVGLQDPIMPPAFSDEIARRVPAHLLSYHKVPDCGHAMQTDQPEFFFDTLRAFISE